MTILWTILLLVFVMIFWLMGILGLPGNWLIAIATGIYTYFVPVGHHATIWWIAFAALALLAIAGEAIETLSSAHGVRKRGGSRRSAVLSFVGAIAGAILGAILGTGILPVVGSILGALIFASGGALLGALLGELWKGRRIEESLKVGEAAFWARLAGSLAKMIIGSVMIAIMLVAICLQLLDTVGPGKVTPAGHRGASPPRGPSPTTVKPQAARAPWYPQ